MDLALQHTPLLIELYVLKAKVFKVNLHRPRTATHTIAHQALRPQGQTVQGLLL